MNRIHRFLTYAHPENGLLLLRILLGVQMALHGWPKMAGGPEKWAKLGSNMELLGIHGISEFWGFMAAFAEFGGGLLLIAGFLFRPALILLIITMIVAATRHLSEGEGYMGSSHAIELGFAFLAMFFTGPGRWAADSYVFKNK
ncbi:MAG: DoxX family protein [Bacteroidetes bacterium]|nr:DoxX family protein [Bacteroidota bacterium]